MPLGRPTPRAVVLSTLAACLLGTLLVPLSASAGPTDRTTICHRTSSATNPYRKITVSQSSLTNANGHKAHTGGVWAPAAQPKWGDVVPDETQGGTNQVQVNWTDAGRAVWNGTTKNANGRPACGRLSAAAFIAAERALNVPAGEIVTDLNAQSANEDAVLLKALGLREFTIASLDQLGAVSATTDPATSVTATTAVLRGTAKLGPTSGVPRFVLGTDPLLLTGTRSVAATPSPTVQTASVSASASGLPPGTPHYYRLLVTTAQGTDAEGVLEGEIRSFTTTGTTTQTITFSVPPALPVGTPTTLPAPTSSSGLPVALSSTTPSVCTVTGTTVTPLAAGSCELAADQAGNPTYAPAVRVLRTIAVTAGPAPQTISFTPAPAHPAGTTSVALAATATSGLQVDFTADSGSSGTCTVSGTTATVLQPGSCTVHADQAGDASWLPATRATRTFTVRAPGDITKSAQTIAFSPATAFPAGTTSVQLDASATSQLPVTFTVDAGSAVTCAVSGTTVTVREPGSCTVHADQGGDALWEAAQQVTGTFTVAAPSAQTIVFEPGATYPAGTASVQLTATATSGLPVDFTASSASSTTCTVSGSTATVQRPGTCTVHADQTGDASWRAATRVTRTFTVLAPVVAPPQVEPTPTPSPRAELPAPPVERVSGRERTETAAQLAEQLYPQPRTAKVVVLARSDVYADGLTGSPLAGTLDGPVLLTEPAQLSAATAAELRRVLAADGTVYVLGGPRAVTPAVAAEVARLGFQVTRIGGVDRYDTATLIADRIGSATSVGEVYLATGIDFPDALSAASAAEVTGGVVLLTRGRQMPAVTDAWLDAHDTPPLTAVGGAAAAASPRATRIVGTDRYSTAAKVAQAVLPEADGVVMVTGTDFPDGLAGASYAARNDWPMLLVDPRATALTPGQDEYLGRLRGGVKDLVAIGGPAALPPAATSLVSARLDRPGVR